MKRFIALIAVLMTAALAVFCFASCDNGNKNTTTDDVTTSETTTEAETTTEESTTETTTTAETTTEDTTFEAVASIPENAVLDRYDIDTVMQSIWSGPIVYNETVMFVGQDDVAPLMYKIDKVFEVRSPDLTKVYVEGKDYVVTEDGKLALVEGTSIPVMAVEDYYLDAPIPDKSFATNPKYVPDHPYIAFGEHDTFIKWQIAVTYSHREAWEGYVPEGRKEYFPKTTAKLEAGEPCTIVWYGDSLTVGGNASGMVNFGQRLPVWARLTTDALAKHYNNNNINYVNTAVGGTGTKWGIENVQERVIAHNPDLVVIAFGANDPDRPRTHVANISKLIDKVKQGCPNAEIIVIATTLPNIEVSGFRIYQDQYEAEYLKSLTKSYPDVAIIRMSTVHQELIDAKKFYHITGNNVNHAGDFLVRAYAQAIFTTITQPSATETAE